MCTVDQREKLLVRKDKDQGDLQVGFYKKP